MKQQNISLILRIIRDNAPVSRIRISEISGLTAASVTKITQKLIEKDLILECGTAGSLGGRPAVNLKLNPDAFRIFGVCFAPSEIVIILTDFEAAVIYEKTVTVSSIDPEHVIETTVHHINSLIKEHNISKNSILGTGVAINGIVDTEKGLSVFAPHYQWKNIEIRSLLEQRLNVPVLIENDTNAMAFAEQCSGIMNGIFDEDQDECFIALNIGTGVGAGIMINGKIYHGCSYSAGEIGHIVVDENGPVCSCGKKGCLETFVSSGAIENSARETVKDNKDNQKPNTISRICKTALDGNSDSIKTVKQVGNHVGLALSGMIATLNPSHIIIGGEIIQSGSIFFDAVYESVRKETLETLYNSLSIIPSSLGRNRAVIGAVTIVLSDFFSSDRII